MLTTAIDGGCGTTGCNSHAALRNQFGGHAMKTTGRT
jgi:hypothetical protein